MNEDAVRVCAMLLETCSTAVLAWSVASRTAVRRGLALGGIPYLTLSLGALGGAAVSAFDAAAAIAASALCAAAACDARTGYIFDPLVAVGLGAVGAAALLTGEAWHAAAGASAVSGTLLGLWTLTGRRGIGLGDVKLGAVVGAGAGPAYGIAALGAAFVLGAASSLVRMGAGRARLETAVPFGPYLAAGTLLVLAYHRMNTGVIR